MVAVQQQQQQQLLLQQLKASAANSQRIEMAFQRLATHVLQPDRQNVKDFVSHCLFLSRGIDFAIANSEVPPKAQDLPSLLKKICLRKDDIMVQAAIMVLMFSVKSACRIAWFSDEESQELLALADEIGCGPLSPSISGNLVSTVSTIMTRFYPLMKMGQILASLEVEPGYEGFMIDFHISKNMIPSTEERIRLFVAQTDKIDTSACVINPQLVNFILNGKEVQGRTTAFMDGGPQLPTNISPMLKYGTNLIQAVGQFNGHYVIIVAFMSMASSLESPKLQDYVQSGIAMQDSDSDLIEGPSRISLNCPISYTRIKTPVKGHSCKHHQCFDFSNFVNINSRRPSWRCPHCNQSVCYTDIRIDKNMVKVLGEVGENVADVIISADGSWKAIMEGDENADQAHDKCLSCEKKGCEQQESAVVANSNPVILDLTNNDDKIGAASIDEIGDMKPDIPSQPVTTNLTMPSELNNISQDNQDFIDDDFWSGILYPDGSASSGARSDYQTVGGICAPTSASFTVSPVLTDAISPALNREVEAIGCSHLTTPVIQNLYSAPNNLSLQQTQSVNPSVNYEYGRSSVNGHLNRTPIAVQALPAAFPQGFTGMEPQQQQFSRALMITFSGPDIASSPLQHQSTAQTFHQHQQQQALNLRSPPMMRQSPNTIQTSSSHPRVPTQQGVAQAESGLVASNENHQHVRLTAAARAQMTRQPPTVPVLVQTPSAGPRYPAASDGVRGSVMDQRENVAGSVQAVRIDNPTDLPSEQNWRPTGRMRGSITGREYNDALNQMTIRPTLPARPHLSPAPHLCVPLPPHLQPFLGNSNTLFPQLQTKPVTDPGSTNGGSGAPPEHSHDIQ